MAIFVVGDLHLSLGGDKPMDVFEGWEGYLPKLEANWRTLISPQDTVILAGDTSWAMKLEDTKTDFAFIQNLPGQKWLLKGNHDYWWSTKTKMDVFLKNNSLDTISILFNNSYVVDGYAICGTRGWFLDNESQNDIKVLNREVGRLEASIQSAVKTGKEPIVFLHYPPVYGTTKCDEIFNVLLKYNIKKCYYGHLHGKKNMRFAVEGEYEGIDFKLISCDRLSFMPILVR